MAKNISLNKKQPEKPEKERFYFFVKNQGEGAARIAVIVLKIIQLILTSVFGICMGIAAPICIMTDFDPDIAQSPAIKFWLAAGIVYVIGTVVIMMGHSKIASAIHTIGAGLVIATYYQYVLMFADVPDNNGPSMLYMPLLFVTIITIVIMLLINVPKWIEAHTRKVNEVAPSILSDKED